jgi:hypothetical protein
MLLIKKCSDKLYTAMDMSMIFHPVYTNMLEETVALANKNMVLKNRGGRKMLTILPTPREPSETNQIHLIDEFHMPKTTNANLPYTMNDIIQ